MRRYQPLFNTLLMSAICIWLIYFPARAQDQLPIPVDTALIFPPSAEVKIIDQPFLYVSDNVKGQVSFYDYDNSQWHSFSYPTLPTLPGERTISYLAEYKDGSFALQVDYYIPCEPQDCDMGEGVIDLTPPHAAMVRERWHFDLVTGTFTPFEAICGDHARAPEGEGEWVIYTSEGSTYVCNTETGQTSQPLPNDAQLGPIPALLRAATLSPDRRWLAFTPYYSWHIYAYDFMDEKFILVGNLTGNGLPDTDYPRIRWVDNQRFILENEISRMGDADYDLYRADISHAEGLEALYHSNYRDIPLRLDNPLRYVWIGKQFETLAEDEKPPVDQESCTSHIYDATTEVIEPYYIPGVCSYGLEIPDGTGDRLVVSDWRKESFPQTVIRFNPDTGKKENIIDLPRFSWLSSLVAGGRYADITLRNDKSNDTYTSAILDLQTKKFVEITYPIEQLKSKRWLDSQTLVLVYPSRTALLRIMDDKATLISEVETPYPLEFSPDGQAAIINNTNGRLDIINLQTQTTTTIANVSDRYAAFAHWIDNSNISVSITSADYRQQFGRWRVHVQR